MARNHLKRKLETYQALACINAHFHAIAQHVFELRQMGFFRAHKMKVLEGFTRELQAQISHDVVDQMHHIEDNDMYEYEQLRRAWEAYLDPDKAAANQVQHVNGKAEQQPQPEPQAAHVNGLAKEGAV